MSNPLPKGTLGRDGQELNKSFSEFKKVVAEEFRKSLHLDREGMIILGLIVGFSLAISGCVWVVF